jgi:hypothetical protein
MTCLSDAEIQAVLDGESDAAAAAHVAACAACAARRREMEVRLDLLRLAAGRETAPLLPAVERRVLHALGEAADVKGATRLRGEAPVTRRWNRLAWSAGLVSVAAVILFLLLPIGGTHATVSAAEVLGRSLLTLSEPASSGIERLEYELTLEGLPAELAAGMQQGSGRVEQLLDHSRPGRFRLAKYSPAGGLLAAIAQDPDAGRRVVALAIDGRQYRFEHVLSSAPALSPIDLQRYQFQAVIAAMQARSDQQLTEIAEGGDRYYQIETPPIVAGTGGGAWALHEARAVVHAGDYRVRELMARGELLGRPFAVSYRLARRELLDPSGVEPSAFELPESPDAVVIQGEGGMDPVGDALVSALREIARLRGGL